MSFEDKVSVVEVEVQAMGMGHHGREPCLFSLLAAGAVMQTGCTQGCPLYELSSQVSLAPCTRRAQGRKARSPFCPSRVWPCFGLIDGSVDCVITVQAMLGYVRSAS